MTHCIPDTWQMFEFNGHCCDLELEWRYKIDRDYIPPELDSGSPWPEVVSFTELDEDGEPLPSSLTLLEVASAFEDKWYADPLLRSRIEERCTNLINGD